MCLTESALKRYVQNRAGNDLRGGTTTALHLAAASLDTQSTDRRWTNCRRLWITFRWTDTTEPSGHYRYHHVLYASENKQWLFPYTALTDWFYNRDGVVLLLRLFQLMHTFTHFKNTNSHQYLTLHVSVHIYDHLQGVQEKYFIQLLSWIPWLYVSYVLVLGPPEDGRKYGPKHVRASF